MNFTSGESAEESSVKSNYGFTFSFRGFYPYIYRFGEI